ncbi:MAG: hypothetical protein Q9226_004156 [Calogaya cf. arnoldii]
MDAPYFDPSEPPPIDDPVFRWFVIPKKLQIKGTEIRVMYLPRSLISLLYQQLVRTTHSQSAPILILISLEPDSLCACRILTALFRRDYIPHKIQPVSGYNDLATAGQQLVQPMKLQLGGSGGVVVCLGVGGMVDISTVLGLDNVADGEDPSGGVQVWLIDARRPWNLGNVFAGSVHFELLGPQSLCLYSYHLQSIHT